MSEKLRGFLKVIQLMAELDQLENIERQHSGVVTRIDSSHMT